MQRATFASALAVATKQFGKAEAIARERWNDKVTPLLLRDASSPASTTVPTWAGTLSQQAVGDFIQSLQPLSAGARLLNAAPRIPLAGPSTISFPRRSGPTAPVALWVEELAPIPVPSLNLQSAVLGPTKKLAAIAVATQETIESGAGEQVLTTLLRESSALALDKKLFSGDPVTDAAPPGLLNGVSALSATPGGDNAAALSDLSKIAATIAPSTSGLTFVAHPAQASYLALRRGASISADIEVWSTLGVAVGTVIGLDPAALASAFGPNPEIKSSREVVLHMEADTPMQISTPGGPPTVAAPASSTFQVDCIATALILRAAWTWRVAGAVSWISGATWGNSS